MKVLEVIEQSRVNRLWHLQDSKCYAFVIFVENMVNKYHLLINKHSITKHTQLLPISNSISSIVTMWSPWDDNIIDALMGLSTKQQARWATLYNSMVNAKKKYEQAGGRYI